MSFSALNEKLSTSPRDSNSIWGTLSKEIYGRNRISQRRKLYLKWTKNNFGIQTVLKRRFDIQSEDLRVCYSLDLLSMKIRTTLVSSAILRIICDRVNEKSSTKMDSSELVWESVEFDLHNDNLLIVCSSAASDIDTYNELKNRYQNISLDSENDNGESVYHTFIHCESILWVDGCRYFDCIIPRIIPGFLQFVELNQLHSCEEFTSKLMTKLSGSLIERSPLVIMWILSTPELLNFDYKLINGLFNKNYVLLSGSSMTKLTSWIKDLKIKVKNNGIEVVRALYTDCLVKLQGLHVSNSNSSSSAGGSTTSPVVDPLPAEDEEFEFDKLDLRSSIKVIDVQEQSSDLGSELDVSCSNNQGSGEFFLELDYWNNICYKDVAGKYRLDRNWTNIFARHIVELNPKCVLKFKHYWIKKSSSRKKNSPFFQAWAVCKFNNCLSFYFSIEDINKLIDNNMIPVKYEFKGVLSLAHSDCRTAHSRHLSSVEREKIGEILINNPASNTFYKQFTVKDNVEGFLHGNFTHLKSKECLRRVKSEFKSEYRFSNNDITDIIATQEYFRSFLTEVPVSGYIQYIAQEPFVVHLYSQNQIALFKLFQKKDIVLNLDATGSLISKPSKVTNKIYYYALTLQHPEFCISPIPVAEMISSDHGTAEISHFLNKWVLTSKLVLHKALNITQVEMDYSWAMMHSTCIAFNKISIMSYLDKCWEFVDNLKSKLDITTVLHLCSAHIMHRVSYNLDKRYKIDKRLKHVILHVLGTMVQSTKINEIDLLFESLCYLLGSEFMLPIVSSSMLDLEALVRGIIEINDKVPELIDEESVVKENSETYRQRSPFGKHFDKIYIKCLDQIRADKGSVSIKNVSYYPNLLEYLLTNYLPILPFWTGIIISKIRQDRIHTDSNAIVENWFKIVKYDIFKSEINIRPGDFIRTIYPHIEDRMASFKFAFQPLAHKIFKVKKRKQELVFNEEECKEEWGKRKKAKLSYIYPASCKIDKIFDKFKIMNKINGSPSRKIKRKLLKEDESIAPKLKCCKTTLESDVLVPDQIEILNDLDVLALGSIEFILPDFKPLSLMGQTKICKDLGLNIVNPVICRNDSNCRTNLNDLIPSLMFPVPMDGNCLFSSLSYLITGSIDNHHQMRLIITDNMGGKFKATCDKFIRNKYPRSVINYRNTKDYITKSNMRGTKTWGTDLELFAATLIFKTDIWVYTNDMGNKWMIYSGKGASLDQIIKAPPANEKGSLYIRHASNHYEPILVLNGR